MFTTKNGDSCSSKKRRLLQMVQSYQKAGLPYQELSTLHSQEGSKQESKHVGGYGPQKEEEARRKTKHHQVDI